MNKRSPSGAHFIGEVKSDFDFLPDEIIREIFKRCSFKDILRAGQTCKRLNNHCYDDSLWQHLCRRDYSICSKGGYSSYSKFYRIFLRKWGHLIGTYHIRVYKLGGIIEVKFTDDCLTGVLWNDFRLKKDLPSSSLNKEILFKVEKHPKNDTVRTLCFFTGSPHPCCFIKNFNSRNYLFVCDNYDEHRKGSENLTYTTMLLIHDLRSGIELQPLLLPSPHDIPESLLNGGSMPCQLMEPGLFRQVSPGIHSSGLYAFYYKNSNEFVGSKITGGLTIQPEEVSMKVFLKYSFIANRWEQSALEYLSAIEVKMNKSINHISELAEQEFLRTNLSDEIEPVHLFGKVDELNITTCKARYHGKIYVKNSLLTIPLLNIREGFSNAPGFPSGQGFSNAHFIVFNNDLLGALSLPKGPLTYFSRLKQNFEPNIKHEDLFFRALHF